MKLQPPGEPVLVGTWEPDDDYGIYPGGTKPKRRLICPDGEQRPYLIPGHAYLFKTPAHWRRQQIWSEILAYQIGYLVGVEVPPAFYAFDEVRGEPGVLVEFFFGYPNDPRPPRLVHGYEFIRRRFPHGTGPIPHAAHANVVICRALGIADATDWWGKLLTFDALIGNTDRHTENWGVLVTSGPGSAASYRMAPVYDNGTSMGYQLDPKSSPDIPRFIDSGCHLCSLLIGDTRSMGHMDLCARYLDKFSKAGVAMQSVIRFDEAELCDLIDRNVCAELAVPMERDRAEMLKELVLLRRGRLVRALGG